MEYILIIVSAIIVNNVVLTQFLGICPFLGVSNKLSTAIGMSGAVVFVMTLATIVTFLVHHYILIPLQITFLQTIA
ncbi:MAG TPA: Rnf-Nqr domain containing protein, partial [Bacteroidales bacterium]|nr:Rnf-Nqr domain containing protein [Bacteroidales bacterium]